MNQLPATVPQAQLATLHTPDPIASGLASIIAGGVTPAKIEAMQPRGGRA